MVNTLLVLIIAIPVAYYLTVYFTKIIHQPLRDYDILDYAISGGMLFDDKSLRPIWTETFSPRGYLYKILHAPSFSLLFTWEQITNTLWQIKSDLYFKSISVYYALLILLVQYYWVAKQNKALAIVSSIALLSGLSFYKSLLRPHIDTYRIFFIAMSYIWLAYSVKNPRLLAVLLFGIFSGFAAFTHRIGLIVALLNCFVFCVMLECSVRKRLALGGAVLSLILIFGGGHYSIDLFLGQGNWLGVK
jgi:hypothetical protein